MRKFWHMLALLLLFAMPAAFGYAAPGDTPAPPSSAQPAPAKKPETAKDYFDLAVKRFQAGDLAGAERGVRTAIALESHYVEAHYLLGRILLFRAAERNRLRIDNRGSEGSVLPLDDKWTAGLAELQEASGQFRIVIKLDPKSIDAWLLLATCLDNLGETDEAESAYKQTFNLDPVSTNARDAHNNLGLLYLKLKKLKEAKTQFEAALTIDPAFGPARLNLDKLKQQRPGLFR
jgi:Tfp pilus assembly protein PilF